MATTYSQMSREYFQTLTTFSGHHWARRDEDDLNRAFKSMPLKLVVGESDEYGREVNQEVQASMAKAGIDVELTIIPSDGVSMPSIRNGAILKYVLIDDDSHSSR